MAGVTVYYGNIEGFYIPHDGPSVAESTLWETGFVGLLSYPIVVGWRGSTDLSRTYWLARDRGQFSAPLLALIRWTLIWQYLHTDRGQ